MPATLPTGEPAPRDGALPAEALAGLGSRPFAFYIHVPFCTTRCGYCDFNTYTAEELGSAPGASRSTYAQAAVAEIRTARRVLGPVDLPVSTVFFGGGTPTLLPPDDLVGILAAIDSEFGLTTDAEVTTEANPDSVDPASLEHLAAGGLTRISYGMQSAVAHVLRTLDRTHDAARMPDVVKWARAAGFTEVSVDLIYGTPGESLADWRMTVAAALALEPDHVSAYSLIVEEGTRLAAAIRRGDLPMPDDDDLADKYLLADEMLGRAGFEWYEVSNWARGPAQRCRHNLTYWTGGDWWGIGPGAHSHVGGVRWWNVKHPAAYAQRTGSGVSPAHGREVLDAKTRRLERVLLELRLADGLPTAALDDAAQVRARQVSAAGLLDPEALAAGRAVLTTRGRLLADAVVRDLVS